MSCLTGFSHLIITAPTIELYTRCKDFYNELGFVTVRHNEPAKHTLLHLFGEQGEKDITVKLVHNEHAHLKESPVEGDWRLQPVCFTVITGDIEVCVKFGETELILWLTCLLKYCFLVFNNKQS